MNADELIAALRAALDTPAQQPSAPSPIATIAAALRNVPPDQLLDLAIAKLRAALPADAEVKPTASMKIPLVPIPGAPR
jgi:hypothetical protein